MDQPLRFPGKLLQGQLAIAGVEQLQLEAPLAAEPPHAGRLADDHRCPRDLLAQSAVQALGHRFRAGAARSPLTDRLETQEEQPLVGGAVAEGASGVEVAGSNRRVRRR